MEKSLEIYYNNLASYREVFSNFDNPHQQRMDAMNEYYNMLENRDAYVSLYSVELYQEQSN